MNYSVKNITEVILKVEKELDLFNWQINNVFIWELIRYKVYQEVLGKFDDSNGTNSTSVLAAVKPKLTDRFKRVFNSVLKNPFFDFKRSDILVFESSRKVNYDGNFIDPFTYFIYSDLIKKKLPITIYQANYYSDRFNKPRGKNRHLDLLNKTSILALKFYSVNIAPKDDLTIQKLRSELRVKLNVDLDLNAIVTYSLKQFRSQFFLYDILLKIKRPKEIYIVNFCDKAALISVAKKRKVSVTDIQHGVISSCDIIYHYPNTKENSLHYFPDRFLVWDNMWKENCKIPLTDNNIEIYENKFLIEQAKKYKHISKTKKQLLIISQPILSGKIATLINAMTTNNLEYNFVYKLHPIEYVYENEVTALNELKQRKDFRFAKRDENIYELFASSQYIIGVYSTAIFESVYFNCKIGLLNLPGIELMEPFKDKLKYKQIGKDINDLVSDEELTRS